MSSFIMAYYCSSFFFICFYINLTLFVAEVVNFRLLRYQADEYDLIHVNNSTVPKDNSEYDGFCLIRECIDTAKTILKNMDSKVQPCDNFYKFACGGFLKSTIIPDGKEQINLFDRTEDAVIEQLRILIEKQSPPNEPRPFKLVKNFYKACMNETASKKRGLQPLLDNLQKLGGWPVLEGKSWNENDFNWTDSVYKFRKLGYPINYFISLNIFEARYYLANYTTYQLQLSPPTFGFPHKHLIYGFQNKYVKYYYKYMVDIAELLGADRNRATVEMKEALEFEIMLVNISRERGLHYGDATIKWLSTFSSSVRWLEFLNAILALPIPLNQDDIIYVDYKYIKDFDTLMNKIPKKVQANYALWRAVHFAADYVTDIRTRKLKLYRGPESKLKNCIKLVSHHLDLSVGLMYFNKNMRKTVLETVLIMVNDIRNEFKKILEKITWMDKETKSNALEKLASMKAYIYYPDEFLDIEKVNIYYEKLELHADDPLGNELNINIFETNCLFNMLNKPADNYSIEWWRSLITVMTFDAFRMRDQNSIFIPATGVQGNKYFNNDRPRYVTYGTLGTTIGHEITHGFDTTGVRYDKKGDLVNWWPKQLIKNNFVERYSCLIEQYGRYRDEDVRMNLNGTLTLDENIADNGGMKAAYYAYEDWLKSNGPERKLLGLSYTPKQMFWISLANSWCTKYRQDTLKNKIRSSKHSPPEFRINGPLSNMKEFSRDFNCQSGSKMNPVRKCVVW